MSIDNKLLAAITLAIPTLVQAKEPYHLPDMEVKAERMDDYKAFSGSSVSEKDLLSGRTSTSDTASLLKNIPGVTFYGAGGVSSLPVIHGLADDRLRMKVDGMDLRSACPNHMNPPFSYLDPSQVGSIKVWAGITPVSVGGDSIGGSIVVETLPPEFATAEEGTLLKGLLGSFYRSNGDVFGGNLSATLAGENVSMRYTGSVATAHNYIAGGDFKDFTATGRPGHALPLDEVGSTAYQTHNHQLDFGLKLNENHLLDAKFGYQHIPYELYPNQRMDMLGNTEYRFNLRYTGQFDWGSLEGRAYHEMVDHHMDFGDDKQFVYGAAPSVVAPGMPMDTESMTTGVRLMASIDLNEQNMLRLGGEYQRYRLDDWWPPSPAMLPPGFVFGGMAPNIFWNINDGKRDRAAFFGEWEARITPQWLTLFGVRYEHVMMDAGEVQGYNNNMAGYWVSADAFNSRDRERNDDNWDISALTNYTLDDNMAIEFGYAMKTRSPNLYERYAWSKHSMAMEMINFVGDGNGYVGDPDLSPEIAHTLSATLDWHSADRSWEIKATPYYTHVTDYIDAKRCAGSGIMMNAICGGAANDTAINSFVNLQFVNQSARLYGVDLSGHMPLASTKLGDLGLRGLLYYNRGKNLDTGGDLYNIMPLNGKLTLTHQYDSWDNDVELLMVKDKDHVSDVRNEIKTPGYILLNLHSSYTWKQVRVDFGIENLLDKLYYLPTGGAYTGQGATMVRNGIPWNIAVPGMGRSFQIGLTLSY